MFAYGKTQVDAAMCPTLILHSNLCHLTFFLTSDKIEDVLGRVSLLEDDESVAEKQVREDIHMFGSRPEPAEFAETDEDNGLYKLQLPRKQSATALEDGINSHAQVRKKLDSRQPHSVTAIDWNNGASHLDAWLNQSAIPAAAPAFREQQGEMGNPPASSNVPTAAQEMEEIKVFRNVHISSASDPVIDERHLEPAEELADELAKSELDTQIYYRNIVDRYPGLPLYLALRLARANRHRAERLRQSKVNRDISHTFHPDQPKVSDAPVLLPQSGKTRGLGEPDKSTHRNYVCRVCDERFFYPGTLKTHMYSHTVEKREWKSRCNISYFAKSYVSYPLELYGCGMRFAEDANSADTQTSEAGNWGARTTNTDRASADRETDYQAAYTQIVHDANDQPEPPPIRPQVKEHPVKLSRGSAVIDMDNTSKREVEISGQFIFETGSERSMLNNAGSDFWTSRISRPRRDSMHSRSSSMNSSLHGKATFDPEEQEPAFHDFSSRSSAEFGDRPRGLPPPPVEIGKKHSFECDICGKTIRVDRRLEWQ